MKKNKFYILFSLLIIVLLFSVSALCNQCGIITPATTATDTAAGKTDVEESKESVSEETTDQTEETTDQTEETTDQTEETSATDESSGNEAPTIKLEIYEGPTYFAADDICYYRVKAVVTGKPAPTIKFSKDDSGGAWGTKKAQVNIHRGETYTLTATAKNSEGEDNASLTLKWGCVQENRNPVISDITISGTTIEINKTYDVMASATDPDGDSIEGKWTVSGGTINVDNTSPIKWTTPNVAGDYTITLKITDSKGGEAIKSKTFSVSLPSTIALDVPKIVAEGGHIEYGGNINAGDGLYAGDSLANRPCSGYISFDITSLAGANIQSASVVFTLSDKHGDPSFFDALVLSEYYWGDRVIKPSDAVTSGNILQNFSVSDSTFSCSNDALKNALQDAIKAKRLRFQLRINFIGSSVSDGDSQLDGWVYQQSNVKLSITYIPKVW